MKNCKIADHMENTVFLSSFTQKYLDEGRNFAVYQDNKVVGNLDVHEVVTALSMSKVRDVDFDAESFLHRIYGKIEKLCEFRGDESHALLMRVSWNYLTNSKEISPWQGKCEVVSFSGTVAGRDEIYGNVRLPIRPTRSRKVPEFLELNLNDYEDAEDAIRDFMTLRILTE